MPAASTPRRSTPRRARSSSVASNASRSSSRAPSSRGKAAAAKKDKDERPQLPEERNPILPVNAVPVKLQVINRENKDIVIGRVKLDTVNGSNHGFLLKRFDTNAIAASSMFRLAFPYADGEAERVEMAYLDRKFDTDRANGGTIAKPATPKRGRPKKNPTKEEEEERNAPAQVLPEGSTGIRLQGTWLPCEDAIEIAQEYGLSLYATPLIEAEALVVDGVPQLVGEQAAAASAAVTPAKTAPDTPSSARKRQRTSKAAEAATEAAEESGADEPIKGTPKASRTRTKREVGKDGVETTTVSKTTTLIEPAENGLSQKEIDAEIKKSIAIAEEVQAARKAASPKKTTASRKRRASNDRPTADLDHLEDDSSVNFVSRNVRRGTRAVRRRPIATGAGAFGVAAAAGVGALAWFSGGQVDVAQQLLQQGLNAFQGFFF